MSPTLRRTISPNTVLLFESGWDILLYESLELISYLEFNDFPLLLTKNLIKIWKKCIFVKISISSFFFGSGCELRSEFQPRVIPQPFQSNFIFHFPNATQRLTPKAYATWRRAPPGRGTSPGGAMPRATDIEYQYAFFLEHFCKVTRTRACRYTLHLSRVLISTLKTHYRTRKSIFVKFSILSLFLPPMCNLRPKFEPR